MVDIGDALAPEPLDPTRRCVCGFAGYSVTPVSAADGLRQMPLRWRDALAVCLDDPDPEAALTGRAAPGAWTALEHAGRVRDVLHALDIRIQRLLREDEPVLPETPVTPPAGANEQGLAVVLAALAVSADQLADTVDATAAGEWSRAGRRAGRRVTVGDLVREAVHEATHHLALATSAVEALRLSAPVS